MLWVFFFRHENDLITEMKALVRQKIMYLANCIENGRFHNLIGSIDDTIEMVNQLSEITDAECTLNLLEDAFPYLNEIINVGDYDAATQVRPELEHQTRGRPFFKIPFETLEFFVENGFKVAEIGRLIGVSKRTVERRLKDYDLGIRQSYSPLTDHELEDEVKKIINDFPHVGYRTMSGLLQVKGHRVQEKRIQHAMRNADSCGVLFRRLFLTASRVQRRTYSVKAPQALWHIDGNHKLIR